jgi:predicted amidohydrolase YtcJ
MKAVFGLALGGGLAMAGGAAAAERQAPADSVIVHGKVYTVEAKRPWAQAVAVRGGKIVAVGKNADIAILSQNVFEVAPAEIGKTVSVLTMVGGRVVHRAEPVKTN